MSTFQSACSVLSATGMVVIAVYCLSYPRGGFARRFRRALRPFIWLLFALVIAADAIDGKGTVVAMWVVYPLDAWAIWRVNASDDDDEDRWRRWLDRAAGMIREVGGRLTMVPVPTK